MGCRLLMFFVGLLVGIPLFAQTPFQARADQAAMVDFAQKAAVRALDFRQGDIESLSHGALTSPPRGGQTF